MRKGISLYPNKSNQKEILKYLERVKKHDVDIVFTSMLESVNNREQAEELFLPIFRKCHELNIDVMIDMAPDVYEKLEIKPTDSTFWQDMFVTMLRMDSNNDPHSLYTFLIRNKDMKIVLNASNPSNELKGLDDFNTNTDQLIGCHNFYPLLHTALGEDFFLEQSIFFNQHRLPLYAFMSSQDKSQEGVFPENDKLPTLEILRDKSVGFQYRYFMATNVVDGLLFSTQFIPESEFAEIESLNFHECRNWLQVELDKEITTEEKKIVFAINHTVRCDLSENILRVSERRISASLNKDTVIKPREYKQNFFLPAGSILIMNSNCGRYMGEIQIVLHDEEIKWNNTMNYCGSILNDDFQYIFKYIYMPWKLFSFFV